MLKLIILVLSLGIGFGAGVLWGQHHPTQAASVSADEEQQIATIRNKIHQLVARQHAGSAADTTASDTTAADTSDTKQVDSSLQELDHQLDSLKAKMSN